MPKRIRRDHPNFELRHARVRVARKNYDCVYCSEPEAVKVGEWYARISEVRTAVCAWHFLPSDIVETDK
jgi:hypothetical protein